MFSLPCLKFFVCCIPWVGSSLRFVGQGYCFLSVKITLFVSNIIIFCLLLPTLFCPLLCGCLCLFTGDVSALGPVVELSTLMGLR